MTKKTGLLLLLLFIITMNAQSLENEIKIDTLDIVFKAKLFTLSQHSFTKKTDLLDLVDKLPYEIYGKHEFLFIKIKSRYFCFDLKNKESYARTKWCDCDYYLCYSFKQNVYFFLGGFKNDNIEEFSKEYYGSLFSTAWDYKIDDQPLNKFIEHIALGKLKKARKCFQKCTESWN
ncbi:hypothetical protein SY27_11100 [Flavobacterium sp. 316]|uniref:hypothetical protein n=1 Tax=Flavobacterium sp. 316 TaxID=1603293 RepID=UPI0005E3A2EA|nr:hypothetical protein [Flavobacterium sp. 316]KIX21285.1 hypothetical protein SY27_11100 [Flavobacterium sp. 316]